MEKPSLFQKMLAGAKRRAPMPHQCSCGKGFTAACNLANHQKAYPLHVPRATLAASIKCDKCLTFVPDQAALALHILTEHSI